VRSLTPHFLNSFLHPFFREEKHREKQFAEDVIKKYRSLKGFSQETAKIRYIQKAYCLKTYGMNFFKMTRVKDQYIKMKEKPKKAFSNVKLGFSTESVAIENTDDHPLEICTCFQIKRYEIIDNRFTLFIIPSDNKDKVELDHFQSPEAPFVYSQFDAIIQFLYVKYGVEDPNAGPKEDPLDKIKEIDADNEYYDSVLVRHEIEIYLEKCFGLKAADLGGTSDPYCEVYVDGMQRGVWTPFFPCKTSKIINKELNPVWNEIISFPSFESYTGESILVNIRVYDHDLFGKDFLGEYIAAIKMKQGGQEEHFNNVALVANPDIKTLIHTHDKGIVKVQGTITFSVKLTQT